MTSTQRARFAFVACLATALTALGCSAPTFASAPRTTTTTTPPVEADTLAAVRCSQVRVASTTNPPVYDPQTTWNLPASCLGTRADSTEWAERWYTSANLPGRTDPTKRGQIDIAFDEYSSPVYDAAEATGQTPYFITGWGPGDNMGAVRTIPWNPSWLPANGADAEMIVIDRTTGHEWLLWGVQPTNWSSCLTIANLAAGYRPGVDVCAAMVHEGRTPDDRVADYRTDSGFSDGMGRGMGAINGLALLPRLDEIERGSIHHALNMETYGTMFGPACTDAQLGTSAAGVSCGFAVAPATRLEWFDGPAASCGSVAQEATDAGRSQTVPEGMRFAIDLTDQQIDDWLDGKGYTGAKRSTARIFAVALRDYGWIISDTSCWGSSVAAEGIANPSARARWAALGIDAPAVNGDKLLAGLITSASQVRAISPPDAAPVVAERSRS